MQFVYMTQRQYRGLTEDQVYEHGSFFTFPNAAHDPKQASDDHNAYFDQAVLAEQVGFDGVALNEHHMTPFCLGSVVDVEAAILARITERIKIILIGNPITASRNPIRLAEELAMIDSISRGRLVTGWVRGSGPEQFANNANPAYNREMFEEGHDLIVQAWTRPGPWRYEGKHFHYRHINPWALPYQKPIPPAMVPGVLSRETALWAVSQSYPYIGLGSALRSSADLWNFYADEAAARGWQAGSENFGHVVFVYCDQSSERAQEVGRKMLYGGGNANFAKAQYTLPAGYNSPAAIKRLAGAPQSGWLGVTKESLNEATVGSRSDSVAEGYRKTQATYEKMRQELQVVVGTPEEVTEKLKIVMRCIRPGMLIMVSQGVLGTEDRSRSIQLIGQHVLPELRAEGQRLGLTDMFERQPGSVRLDPGQTRAPVVDMDAIEEFLASPTP